MNKWITSLTAMTMVFSSIARADVPFSSADAQPVTEQYEDVDASGGNPIPDTARPANDFEFSIPTSEPNTSTDSGDEDTDAKALDEPDEEPAVEEVAEVSKDPSDGVKEAEKKRTWQRVGIAVAAVIVATIALILVSSHPGHK